MFKWGWPSQQTTPAQGADSASAPTVTKKSSNAALKMQRYRQRMKEQDPEKYARYLQQGNERATRSYRNRMNNAACESKTSLHYILNSGHAASQETIERYSSHSAYATPATTPPTSYYYQSSPPAPTTMHPNSYPPYQYQSGCGYGGYGYDYGTYAYSHGYGYGYPPPS
ncbi:uncharacterized protein VTP21DRAFT_4934 [Calcarisporiella thermophila]|uniref:uncharacterized protein n=1 Tax=Calcarisporiella thermophila TaxID=911321 RepID=UPI0037446A3F